MPPRSSPILATFPNPEPSRPYEIAFDSPEFTCVCPTTGNPDFAKLAITYSPSKLCVELKSLKLYLFSFRDVGTFHEAVTNRLLDDLVSLLVPRWMRIVSDWNVRGGIRTVVSVEHHTPQARRRSQP